MPTARRTRNVRAESRCRYYVRQTASSRGWDLRHLRVGGNVLEEQEIEEFFPNIGLQGERPDFIFCIQGQPQLVVETKNEAGRLQQAIDEAKEYIDKINRTGNYNIRIAVGAAGEEDKGFEIAVWFKGATWQPLMSNGFALTSFPSLREVELALLSNNGLTEVEIPSTSEFIDTAVEISGLLRLARIEAHLRPKVIGAVVLAMYQGQVDTSGNNALTSVNQLVTQAVEQSVDLSADNKNRLIDALRLSGADFNRLTPFIGRVTALLNRLNIRSVIHTDADFLGMFYEAFLRYGYDNNALGIVFTPRHITRLCVEVLDATSRDRVIDIACGTGGFLVSAFDKMLEDAPSDPARDQVKRSMSGFDTNPTVWALAILNTFFRGDGKSHIFNDSCFDDDVFANHRSRYTKAFLNPPFSQENEPERKFIDRALEALEPQGMLAVVVKAGIFADDEHMHWRRQFLTRHKVLAVISLPEELFYPTAAPTSILIAEAHVPTQPKDKILFGRIWNDGYEKLKGRRVKSPHNQIPEIVEAWIAYKKFTTTNSQIVVTQSANRLTDGEEWSPQKWLPQPDVSHDELQLENQRVTKRMFEAVSVFPELTEAIIKDFTATWQSLPNLPEDQVGTIADFFLIGNGRSVGEKHYNEGNIPYISSGDPANSIVRLVQVDNAEAFVDGGITVTAFGLACVQPWQFAARGNGGSSVRVLTPRYKMNARHLIWFAAQINLQRWRFFYARMAIMQRIRTLEVRSPNADIIDNDYDLVSRLKQFKSDFETLSYIN